MSAAYDYTTKRLFVQTDLQPGQAIKADRAQANYLLNVMRLGEGANILLFNGRDGEWMAEIKNPARKSCDLVPFRQTRCQTDPYRLTYLFAPLKKGRLDYMVQKAVEMGAGKLQPVITQFTQNTKFNADRLNANIMEAAEQCGILNIPQLAAPVKLEHLLDNWDSNATIVYCDEAIGNVDSINELKKLKDRPLSLLIGPEGGFSPEERERLRSLDYVVPISLGPRILRADTAAVAAMAVVQAIAGDW